MDRNDYWHIMMNNGRPESESYTDANTLALTHSEDLTFDQMMSILGKNIKSTLPQVCGTPFRCASRTDGYGYKEQQYGVILKKTAKTITFHLPYSCKSNKLSHADFKEKYGWRNENFISIQTDKIAELDKCELGKNPKYVDQIRNTDVACCMFFDDKQRNAWYDAMDTLEKSTNLV